MFTKKYLYVIIIIRTPTVSRGVYQEAYYDYESLLHGDDVRITALVRYYESNKKHF